MASFTLATLQADVENAIRKRSPFITPAIVDAFLYVRGEELWFNGANYKFDTVAGVQDYALPGDFLKLRGGVFMREEVGGSTRVEMVPMPLDELERYNFDSTDADGYWHEQVNGMPAAYAIDRVGKRILIAPKEAGGHVVEFRYSRDFGTPSYTATTTSSSPPSMTATYTMTGPDGQTIPSTFTSPLLDYAYKLLKERALYELYSNYEGGNEQMAANSQRALMRYLEELQRLRAETTDLQSVSRITGFI